MLLIITDLDGTLLDADYSYAPALPALRLIKSLQIPLVFCTSKTRAEVEECRRQIGNCHPFIAENGGALYIPDNYFPQDIQSPVRRDGYAVIEFGYPYNGLVEALRQASEESGCQVRAFSGMSAEEISRRYNLSLPAARLSKQREYDEPFEILSGDERRLFDAIEKRKKRWTRGGRLFHILGANDKAHCVNLLCHFYARAYENIVSVGLGDGLNDAGFLNLVDIPILLASSDSAELKRAVPRGRLSPGGPGGWNDAVLGLIDEFRSGGGKAGVSSIDTVFSGVQSFPGSH